MNVRPYERRDSEPKTSRVLAGVSLYWLGLSVFTDATTNLLLPAIIGSRSSQATATKIGIVTSAALLAAMVVQPLWGRMSDRTTPGVTRLLWVIPMALGSCLALLGAAASTTVVRAGVLFALALISVHASQAPYQALAPDLVPPSQRGSASGFKGLADLLGASIGFVLIGKAIGDSGFLPAAASASILLLLALAAAAVFLRGASGVPEDSGRTSRSGQGGLVALAISRFLFLLGTYAVGRFFLLFVAERLGVPMTRAADEAGAILAALALGTALFALAGGWASDRWGRRSVMIVGCLVNAAGAVLMVFAHTPSAILGFGLILAAGSGAFSSANWAAATDRAPGSNAGFHMGLFNASTIGAAIAAGAAGFAIDAAANARAGSGASIVLAISAFTSLAALVPLSTLKDKQPAAVT